MTNKKAPPDDRKTAFDQFDIHRAGVLPDDFHQKVFDLEIKMDVGGESIDAEQQVKIISSLMSLYSVSHVPNFASSGFNFHFNSRR